MPQKYCKECIKIENTSNSEFSRIIFKNSSLKTINNFAKSETTGKFDWILQSTCDNNLTEIN